MVPPAPAAQCAIYGNFSAPKAQEIVVSRVHTLELIRPADNGRMQVRLEDRRSAAFILVCTDLVTVDQGQEMI